MDSVNVTITDIFIVSILLVIVAYFAGFASDVRTVSAATNSLILTATGRNAQGNFASYPGGGPSGG